MHAARLDRSDRLRRVYALLADGREHSTLEIVQGAGVCAVNACIAELRDNGAVIDCRVAVRQMTGERVWLYRLVRSIRTGGPVPGAAA